ncbi:MAG TPA: crossover junction endodeoxyribonuclease RuvC [Fimbriimonas sp.]|nr:crossover junction endodeoxyribonuclease RuvC [Fimbriimonas sp.]
MRSNATVSPVTATGTMIILGIDPGLERVGYGIVERKGSQLKALGFGLIQTPRINLPDRLRVVHEAVLEIISDFKPDAMATERLLFTVNKTTAMDVSKSLGTILLAASFQGLPWCEYSPPEIKNSVVGVGNADKKQVQFMVAKLLRMDAPPKPDDVADALAVAITHAFHSRIGL